MMEPFERIDIQELPLSVPSFRHQVEDFLGSNGLRLGEVDLYRAVLSDDGAILAGGGLQRDIIKCLAVSPAARSLGLSLPLISHLISVAAERGYTNVKVFTKPENLAMFESLGFKLLASAPKAILMENGRGLEDYCAYLRKHRANGVIVMNANPFTLGHRYLVEQSARKERLVVIPVKEDASRFPYGERVEMIRKGSGDLAEVVEGSDYQISAATFPTYFLKDLSDAAETQMRLDIDLFGRHIAPALGATMRFVGSEPTDALTARYNALMQEMLPAYGVRVVEIPRLTDAEGPVSASRVRKALDEGRFPKESTPVSSWPFLMAELAERALRIELDTPMKPGLVGPDSVGAHRDMDYSTMRKGIAAIRPFFAPMAVASDTEELRQLGIDAERAMMAATGGVNTHRGAIFALGLALNAGGDSARMARLAAQICGANRTLGARQMALGGYRDLFDTWLPYYQSVKVDDFGLQKTLLKIMSTLDDTCVIHRVGYDRARQVKADAKALLGTFSPEGLQEMNRLYAADRVSPGGAADMLALTIFMDSILY
jgi:[citrate (pro-3S)-lyase] ligase